ncbi:MULTISPECIES: helix-turn-helix domain-containing protein [Bacillus]|uniref:helix-turn-helix domain-containing protein n=1 Tax=Bacillus TaxID=1386 RepID=UPI001C244741|nr:MULTISPECIES: helix-turn-helix transcriptional regulator [Bacillus]MBU8740369.1 helix-turn-helix transcriptional regulator [Bacillus licheniformis]MCF7617363.1 helix-turn-helix transcriptional regulator [Bacillus sonorensis]MCY8663663.1 helix-turn-helix transcriptional regulator [Bacillus haynesii]
MTVGERIAWLREKRNWNQKDLANKVGLNTSVMNRIEKGKRPLTDAEIVKFAEVLDTTTDYLLGRYGQGKKDSHTIKESLGAEAYNDPDLQIAFREASDFSEEAKQQAIDFIKYLKEKEKKRNKTN